MEREFPPDFADPHRARGETRAEAELRPDDPGRPRIRGETRADRAILDVAARQHGVVTTRELLGAGFSRDAITRRVRQGWLTRLHRGVYQVGPIPAPLGPEAAALLACGPGAVLSHHTAAALWQIRPPHGGPRHVTTADDRDPRHERIRTHKTRHLPPSMRAVQHGLPLTTAARTLRDLRSELPRAEWQRAAEQAQILRLATRAELGLPHEAALTRSEAEARLLDLLRAARLPSPRTNVRLHGYEVDMLWPERRLVVEVDGFAFHSTREAFERDRLRDTHLQSRGHRVVRVTWRQIAREPEALLARLAVLLA